MIVLSRVPHHSVCIQLLNLEDHLKKIYGVEREGNYADSERDIGPRTGHHPTCYHVLCLIATHAEWRHMRSGDS